MVLWEPVGDRGREQEQLIAIGLTKVDRHAPIVPRDPNRGWDGRDSCDSLSWTLNQESCASRSLAGDLTGPATSVWEAVTVGTIEL